MPLGVQEEDWWKAGNASVRQVPMTVSLTDPSILVNVLNAENGPTLPTIANSTRNQRPQQRNSSDDFEEELMGVRRWPFLIRGFQDTYKSIIIVSDERNLRP